MDHLIGMLNINFAKQIQAQSYPNSQFAKWPGLGLIMLFWNFNIGTQLYSIFQCSIIPMVSEAN